MYSVRERVDGADLGSRQNGVGGSLFVVGGSVFEFC